MIINIIVVIVGIILLCIIPTIGTRRPRGYHAKRNPINPLPPSGFGSYRVPPQSISASVVFISDDPQSTQAELITDNGMIIKLPELPQAE